MIAYVGIGNSDDKLSQALWALFVSQTSMKLRDYGRVYGQWLSEPASAWQNACWCVEFVDDEVEDAKTALGRLAAGFTQDSIAWAEVKETEFLKPIPDVPAPYVEPS